MKIEIQEIDIQRIDRGKAIELMNEINKATGGKLYFTQDYPRLKELHKLLNACFLSSVTGVHIIDGHE